MVFIRFQWRNEKTSWPNVSPRSYRCSTTMALGYSRELVSNYSTVWYNWFRFTGRPLRYPRTCGTSNRQNVCTVCVLRSVGLDNMNLRTYSVTDSRIRGRSFLINLVLLTAKCLLNIKPCWKNLFAIIAPFIILIQLTSMYMIVVSLSIVHEWMAI